MRRTRRLVYIAFTADYGNASRRPVSPTQSADTGYSLQPNESATAGFWYQNDSQR